MRVACLLLALPCPALAQEAPEVVVLGTPLKAPPGTPAYGSVVIDRERLTGDASGRVEDVLLDVAGFQQFRRSDSRSANPSAQGVTLRALGGNATSRALVLLDGVPIADPFFGYIPFNALVPGQLGAVRVTRGGGAGAFGAGAVAGTIELESATRANLPALAASADYGSFNSVRAEASAAPRLGAGFIALGGRWERSDGFFTTPLDQRVPASARARFADWSASARAVVPIDAQTEVQARLSFFRDDRTLRFTGADSFAEGQDASVRLIHRGRWQVEALGYLQARDFGNKVVSATSFRLTLDQRKTPSTGYGGKIELRPPVGPDHVLRIGADVRVADGRLFEDAYSAAGSVTARRTAGGRITTAGAYAEDDWTLGRLVLTGGVRVDRWTIAGGFFRELAGSGAVNADRRFADRSGTEVTGRAGLAWRAAGGVTLRAAGYTGFRVPTLNELYRPFVVFPVTTQANEALAPERLRGGEIGIDLVPARGMTIGLTAFHNRLEGAIGNVTLAPNLRQRQNLHAITAQGIEVTANVHRGPWSLTASYAYSDSRVRQPGPLDGLRPAQSPQHSASATLGWTPRRGPALSATLRHVGAQFEDDLQIDRLPPATTLDATARLPIGRHIAISLRAENVTDSRVVTRNAAGSIDLGTPRTLWIGVRLTP
ncbi:MULTISPECIES: TonB-dependent receptor [Sphingomonas]|uniref:TonB-dependent receptor n=1 Tax=Sphingomonas TaxID=13687 RepID=UPI00082B8AED|nr:TonB-dependent receptor [Sphingomonas sp. CCH10-B3]